MDSENKQFCEQKLSDSQEKLSIDKSLVFCSFNRRMMTKMKVSSVSLLIVYLFTMLYLGNKVSQVTIGHRSPKVLPDRPVISLPNSSFAIRRKLPDLRHYECRDLTYPFHGLKTSIIIIFYNEDLRRLLRTVQSVLDRSPSGILHEIILIDDFSTEPELMEPLETAIKPFEQKIRLKRTEKTNRDWTSPEFRGQRGRRADTHLLRCSL